MAVSGFFQSLTANKTCYPEQRREQALNQTASRRNTCLAGIFRRVGLHRKPSLAPNQVKPQALVIDG